MVIVYSLCLPLLAWCGGLAVLGYLMGGHAAQGWRA